MTDIEEVLVWQDGAIGRIRLNRPKALNAIDHAMVIRITEALVAWETDDDVSTIIIDSDNDRAFCAGGDIRALCVLGKSDVSAARQFLFDEYQLNALISGYPKPYVALMDGLAMGGGVGLSAHGSHRIVTERTTLALPETLIGFLPDIGATYLLSRAPGKIGLYLGVTGRQIHAADAIYAGFADTHLASDKIEALCAALIAGEEIDAAIAVRSSAPERGQLADLRGKIDEAFGYPTLVECEMHLVEMSKQGDVWAEQTLEAMSKNSPYSMAATFAATSAATQLPTLEACISAEYRFVFRAVEGHDLYEGVRALLIDKDKNPKWAFKRLADIPPERINESFASLNLNEWHPLARHLR